MANDQSDLESRIENLERGLESRRTDDLVREVRTLEHRVESLMSTIWITGVVVTVVAVILGLFTPYAVDDDETRSLAGLVFSLGEAAEDSDSMVVWVPLAIWFLVAVLATALIIGLRSRRVSSRWQTTATVMSWIFVVGCLGGFALLLIADSRNRNDIEVFPPGLLLLSLGAAIAALMTTAGRTWIEEPSEPTYRRL